jgi:hypothetical protein
VTPAIAGGRQAALPTIVADLIAESRNRDWRVVDVGGNVFCGDLARKLGT